MTALDQYKNVATGYTGTVHFTSTDGAAVLPSNYAFTSGTGSDNGVHTFSATFKTAGNQTITATDTTTSSITGTSGTVAVSVTASRLVVSAPSTATAGSPFSITVTATDQNGSTAPGYTGTVHFTTTDSGSGIALPANYTFVTADNGVHTFTNGVTLVTAGNQTVTATDTTTSSITGTTNTIAVSPSTATHFTVSAPSSATAGTPFIFTVTALDGFNNTATGYGGTAHFTSTDGAASLPADSTFSNGLGRFVATLGTAGNQTLTATDTNTSSITGTSGKISVGVVTSRLVVSTPASATAGSPFKITVTAEDQFNNTITGYTGTVHFTTTDSGSGIALPANYTFVTGDNGVHTFTNGVTLVTAGNQTVTATDTTTSSITGTTNTIAVSPATATHFTVSAPSTRNGRHAVHFHGDGARRVQ